MVTSKAMQGLTVVWVIDWLVISPSKSYINLNTPVQAEILVTLVPAAEPLHSHTHIQVLLFFVTRTVSLKSYLYLFRSNLNMTLTSTSDSKSASPDSSSNLIKMSAPPLSIVILTIISLLIAIVMMALSVANFGMPSVSMVVGLNLLYHIVFIFVVFIHRKNFSSAIEHHTERAEDKSFDYFDMAPLKPQSIAFSKWNITCLVFLFVANFIAFSVLVDDTTDLGAMGGTLPVEPSQQWIFKIQLTQTVVLGCQLLTIATTLGISAWGRRRIILEEEDRLQEAQYEF